MRQSLSEKTCGALSQVTGTGLHFQRSSVNVFQIKQEPSLSFKNKSQIAKTVKFTKIKSHLV